MGATLLSPLSEALSEWIQLTFLFKWNQGRQYQSCLCQGCVTPRFPRQAGGSLWLWPRGEERPLCGAVPGDKGDKGCGDILRGHINRGEKSRGAGKGVLSYREAGAEWRGGGDGAAGRQGGEAVPGGLRAVAASSAPETGSSWAMRALGSAAPGAGPAEGDKAAQGTGSPLIRGKTEGVGLFSLGKRRLRGISWMCINI